MGLDLGQLRSGRGDPRDIFPLERGQQGACREDLLARPVVPCSKAESQWNSDCVTPWVDSGNPHKHARHVRHIKHSLLKGEKEMIDFIHLKESQR